MVQRQAPNKLGIQPDSKNYVKSDKRSMALKSSSSSQHQDSRNKGGTELKKKMKKSRSMKLADLENMGLPPMTRAKSRPNRPTTTVSSSAATPQKPCPVKISDSSPNYMKSTSSSDARKEQLQVSPGSSQTSCNSKNSNRRISNSSKPNSASSGHKTLRTLTKTSSFKPARPSLKKCSGFALYSDLKVDKATCSSTLKDSKFPDYVTLHPGGTESEGTSVLKVCPYTHCSLNGHCHAPLPPLKRFLSARRRLLKTQKSMRLNCLSPRRAKASSERKKEIDTGQMAPTEDLAIREADSASSVISPMTEEVGIDFFVEIYAKPREDNAESIGRSIYDGDDEGIIDFMPSDGKKLKNEDREAAESQPDESSNSEICFEDDLDQNNDIFVAEMDVMAFPEHYQQVEVEDKYYPPSFAQAETGLGCCIGNELEGRDPAEIELGESVSETTEMDWEEMLFAAPILANGADNSTHSHDESDLINVYLPEFDTNFGDEKYESDDAYQNMETDVSSDGSDSLSQDQLFSSEDACEKPEAFSEEKDGDAKSDDNFIINMVSPASAQDPLEELTAAIQEKNGVSEPESKFLQMYPLFGDDETDCIADVEYETVTGKQENGSEIDQDVAPEELNIEAEVGPQLDDLAGEGCMLKGQKSESVDLETDQDVATSALGLEQELSSADAAKEKEQVDVSLPPVTEEQFKSSNLVGNKELSEKDQGEGWTLNISSSIDSTENGVSERNKSSSSDDSIGEAGKMQVEDSIKQEETEETCLTSAEKEKTTIHMGSDSHQETPKTCSNLKGTIRCKRSVKDLEEPRKFNPREPQYLPLELDPEAEKVDLRHQMMDERKNSEEWMLDYALRQAVTKLAPARRRKVALLVEAFETVIPIPKCETHLRDTAAGFAHARSIQACN
ncbi:hypothetical protein HHK36_017830 [Tetracentron sinense]|uniref:Calmodulin-binding domain-containing protein n=1 Tax=Tetracentron sinense TaxID=13715 RepID=A0A834Z3H1_TETSI|nr:hypothetical protein HHK36_017830 [Tetracentron sinense]